MPDQMTPKLRAADAVQMVGVSMRFGYLLNPGR